MKGKLPSIAIIMGKASKKPMQDEGSNDESDSGDEVSQEEIDAMKLFEKASSPEQKAEALKMFLKACGVY